VKEYELYVPLAHNDGTPVDPKILVQLRERLLAEFGGLTFFPQPNEGFWTFGGVTYRDEISSIAYCPIASGSLAVSSGNLRKN